MKADYHVHTTFSTDGSNTMEEMINQAIVGGLNEICFTDHVDYGIKRDWNDPRGIQYYENEIPLTNVDYPKYFALIDQLKQKYGDKITIKKGLELGAQMHTIEENKVLMQSYPVDFALLSVHQVNDLELWNQHYQHGKTQDEYNMGYYQEIYKVMQHFKDYCVLAHLDHIVRYDLNGDYSFDKIKPIISDILKLAISNGKGIELNTSSLRYHLKDSTPSKDILLLYKELGGKIITIGSDAHDVNALANGVSEGKIYLQSLGYKSYCTFTNMQPIYHDLSDLY